MPTRFNEVISLPMNFTAPPSSGSLLGSFIFFAFFLPVVSVGFLTTGCPFGAFFAEESALAFGISLYTARKNLDLLYRSSNLNSALMVLVCVLDKMFPSRWASRDAASQ